MNNKALNVLFIYFIICQKKVRYIVKTKSIFIEILKLKYKTCFLELKNLYTV